MIKKSHIAAPLISAVLLSSFLAGCGNQTATPSEPSSSSKGPVTITFWNEMTGPYETALSGEIQQFEKLHPNITVKDVVVPNDAALEPKLLAAVVAGDPPTLSQMNPPWATGFIQTGSLVNLNPFISGPHGFSLASFYPNMLKPGKWPNGDQYLMPFNLGAAIMYYNKNAFTNAGITTPPTTWTQFAQDASKLSGPGKQAFAITLVHTYPWLAFFDQAGGNFVGSNGMPNPAAFASNGPAVKALTLWSNMVKNGSAILTHGYASQTDFANETSFILIGTTGFYPYLQQAVGNKFTIAEAPLPHNVKQATSLFGGYLGMFSKATPAQQQAGFAFIKYLTSKAGQTYWMEHSEGYLPVRSDVAAQASQFLSTHPAQQVSLSVLNTAIAEPKVAWWDQFSHEVLLNAIIAVLLNKETPVQAMHSAYQQAVSLAQKDGTYQ
ncbi:ABC transporter substrate-binding protein [Sulfobacillus thermosulfidooxidans]|uniref:ABC transporter substrate-binding protein n=1 Tax=Sulfobacillus thermosulfidooxidans TaxID=28034 RepID=UPI0006B57965|nr:ABC transporter substrate-binding protein [Sulfobacillus thermosulfidooxidans]